jgi:hypothetical protein
MLGTLHLQRGLYLYIGGMNSSAAEELGIRTPRDPTA